MATPSMSDEATPADRRPSATQHRSAHDAPEFSGGGANSRFVDTRRDAGAIQRCTFCTDGVLRATGECGNCGVSRCRACIDGLVLAGRCEKCGAILARSKRDGALLALAVVVALFFLAPGCGGSDAEHAANARTDLAHAENSARFREDGWFWNGGAWVLSQPSGWTWVAIDGGRIDVKRVPRDAQRAEPRP